MSEGTKSTLLMIGCGLVVVLVLTLLEINNPGSLSAIGKGFGKGYLDWFYPGMKLK